MKIRHWSEITICTVLIFIISFLSTAKTIKLLMYALPILFILVVVVSFACLLFQKSTSKENTAREFPIFFQVPENHEFVLRLSFGSNSDSGRGYWSFKEGWAFWIPGITVPLGIFSMKKIQTDLEGVSVNDKNSQEMNIDIQVITKISDSIQYATSIPGKNAEEKKTERKEIEKSLFHTGTNRAASKHTSEELISQVTEVPEGPAVLGDKFSLGDEIACEFEKELNPKDIDKTGLSLIQYGISIESVGVQKTYAPEIIEKALERRKAAKIEKESAKDEAAAVKIMIDETGANPTVVMVSQIIADSLRGFLGRDKQP